ncbi:MAG TPA: hypothetical protein VFJ72_02225 [Rubrobacteraceae bacterium]|nr:hypothetical protein [Rubrobacteraceae bacterium]
MVELAERAVDAAYKIKNLEDYDRRLRRAARRVDETSRGHGTAALVIYEAALMSSGRTIDEVRELVDEFHRTWEDEEEPLTIPRVSGIMNVHGDEWFFGDSGLRRLAGRLLGQFQHRVAQYNYVDEREVLKRWADSYDTRLFIRRRILGTEPVVGVVGGLDLQRVQYLRVIAGGNTLVPSQGVARALEALGFETNDDYEILGHGETLALHMDLPAPVVGALLEDLARDDVRDFPAPPRSAEEPGEEGPGEEGPGEDTGTQKPDAEQRAARRATAGDPGKGEEPTRVQDPQARDTPGVPEESGEASRPASPRSGKGAEPGTSVAPEDKDAE